MAAINIDFSSVKFDLKELAESRLLSQFYNSKILKLLLNVYTSEIQELSDAIYDLIRGRSLNYAQGKQLDAIGRIVGRDRRMFNYNVDYWFAPDETSVQPDNGHWWVQNQEPAVYQDMEDETYKKWLWMQILENHNLFSSTPELEGAIQDGIGETVGIERQGPMEAKLYVTPNISLTNKGLLSYNKDDELTENDYLFAYPATTNIDSVEEN